MGNSRQNLHFFVRICAVLWTFFLSLFSIYIYIPLNYQQTKWHNKNLILKYYLHLVFLYIQILSSKFYFILSFYTTIYCQASFNYILSFYTTRYCQASFIYILSLLPHWSITFQGPKCRGGRSSSRCRSKRMQGS